MVGGVNSPVRSFRSVGGHPLVIQEAKGKKIYDADQNAYTDYCLSWGALILGHAHPDVVLAVQKGIRQGTHFGTTTHPEIEMAQFLVRHIPSLDRVRLVNSGTEATMSAVRVARGYTKRNKIVKFDGCYHGHFDDFLIKAGSGVNRLKKSSSQGIPSQHLSDTISLPFNNGTVLADVLERFHHQIACVIIEPIAGNMGVVPADKGFLKILRRLTAKYKIILIFDEIITGFRTCLGGVQLEWGIIPDMTCLGKIIGGGFPVGAYGGRKDIMQCLAPLGGVYQAGTFSGNPVVMRAGLATLKNLNQGFYRRLNSLAERFAADLNSYFERNHTPAFLSSHKSMMSLWFDQKCPLNYTEAMQVAWNQKYARLFRKLLSAGIYWPPANLESFFISGAHEPRDLDLLSDCIKDFLK